MMVLVLTVQSTPQQTPPIHTSFTCTTATSSTIPVINSFPTKSSVVGVLIIPIAVFVIPIVLNERMDDCSKNSAVVMA